MLTPAEFRRERRSLLGCGQAPFGQQLVHEGTTRRNVRPEAPQLRDGVLRPLQDESVAGDVQVQAIPRLEVERPPYLGRNDEAPMTTQDEGGIHHDSVPSEVSRVDVPYLPAGEVSRRLDTVRAADALEAALLAGIDPEADVPRTTLPVGEGELLVMPAVTGRHAAVKLVTVGGDPRVQGVCVLFDGGTLAPVAIVDGIALTLLRTAAVSALAVRRLADPQAERLLVFGRGPQAYAHVAAIRAERPIRHVDLIGRDHPRGLYALIAAADVICCATTAREPVLDGHRVADHAAVVAIGSHEPDARETDDALADRATVLVESRASALREAGDVLGAIAAGALTAEELVTLADLVRGGAPVPADRPRLFKSTGMAWEDAVIAAALVEAG